MYYLKARYYDPETARFISKDSVRGRIDPISQNAYVYAVGNPINVVDPSGSIVETAFDAASIGISAYDFYNDPSWSNAGYLAWDIAASFIPFVPGSWAVKTGRFLSKADDFAGIGNYTRWNKGSFGNSAYSLERHFIKHGQEVGAEDVSQYLRKAEEFARNLRGAQKYRVDGAVDGVMRYVKNGKYIDLAPDGSIISFGRR